MPYLARSPGLSAWLTGSQSPAVDREVANGPLRGCGESHAAPGGPTARSGRPLPWGRGNASEKGLSADRGARFLWGPFSTPKSTDFAWFLAEFKIASCNR
jgi:hypothetical protein